MKTTLNHLSLVKSALFGLLILAFASCHKVDETTPEPVDETNIENMVVEEGFAFRTSADVNIQITTLDNVDQAVPGILVELYSDYPSNGGGLIVSGTTDADGIFTSDYVLPAGTDSVALVTPTVGFVTSQKIKVTDGKIDFVLGGQQVQKRTPDPVLPMPKSTNSIYHYLSTFTSSGVPTNLVVPNDVIDASIISDINATLPEYQALPTSHPQYFNSANEPNLVLSQACDVWVTFVHEGAGYRNALGFYKYNTNTPPASASAIDTIHIIFPNCSFAGSGGNLYSGNKVKIGTFAPGTEIGWVIIADGWNGSTVGNGLNKFYSDKNLNPETSTDKKQHTILCNDIGRGKFLLGFEDLRRDGGCDNDFNDAVFYVTANPIAAIQTQNIPLPNYTQTDSDGDGVSNSFDAYPNDATKAFNNFYPSETTVGTLAFEDLWPSKGDYDFNDMVVDYRFNQITNGQNKVVQINAKFILKAIGATFKNGFGLEIPISPSLVASVTGTSIKENFIVNNANGTEANQNKATIIVFDNAFNELPYPGGNSIGVNTTMGSPYVTPKEFNITINLTQPQVLGTIGLPPYNPFLIVNMDRSKEVHLVNHAPTSLANTALLGSSQDDSRPAQGRFYVTEKNLPYAIDIAGPFEYPVEKAQVTQAFLKFFNWGTSSGVKYYDWYKPISGYRNNSVIFTH